MNNGKQFNTKKTTSQRELDKIFKPLTDIVN